MSRSRKKHAWVWLTKKWAKWHERAFRHRVKRALHEVEIDFDPDRDWEEATLTAKQSGKGEYGTRCGFSVAPSEDELDVFGDPMIDHYEEMLRK